MTDPNKNQNRRPPGTPAGGQFGFKVRPEVDLDSLSIDVPAGEASGILSGTSTPAPTLSIDGDPDDWDAPDAPDRSVVVNAKGDELWTYVRHRNRFVRADAATSTFLTSEQLAELASADQPYIVRQTVAQLPYAGVAELASHDPDPVIRFIARDGFDLSQESRDRLDRDPFVGKLTALLEAEAVG